MKRYKILRSPVESRRFHDLRLAAGVFGWLCGWLAPVSEAGITKIEITAIESPTAGGATFGAAGVFEKLTGTAYGELDPADPANAIITDIRFAPRNARGRIEYSMGLVIIRPIDPSRSNGMLWYHVVNRGRAVPIGGTRTEGDPFLQSLGYTWIASGWQGDLLPAPGRLTMSVPVASNGGASITGLVRAELKVDKPAHSVRINGHFDGSTHASYAPVNLDGAMPNGPAATMTVRTLESDPRVLIPAHRWDFGSCPDGVNLIPNGTEVCLRGEGFQPGRLYELIYTAKDPLVLGIGFAGMRDLIAFFKYESADAAGAPNPLLRIGSANDALAARETPKAIFSGASQSGRAIRTFIHLGFNADEQGRRVFDGALPLIGGGRIPLNVRFGQPGRAWGHRVDHVYPAYEFPFSYAVQRDPLTGRTSGVTARCERTATCPKIMHFATALEIWEGRQSLGITDPLGREDVADPSYVRTYIQTSTQHGPSSLPLSFPSFNGIQCRQQGNPNDTAPTVRALASALTAWVQSDKEPPASAIPMIRDGTLVLPEEVRFPKIPATRYGGVRRPAVRFTGVFNPLHLTDFGPLFSPDDESGIITIEPPVQSSEQYVIRVPQVDRDGNDLGGIRSIAVLAPTATYTGWNILANGKELCPLLGSYIPFAKTRAERTAAGDPRRSLEERYKDHAGYVAAVRNAADTLVSKRFLLPEDAAKAIGEAEQSDILR